MDIKQDLHIHTCFSDGALRPETIVDRWKSEGYKLIAVTDHDDIEGSRIAYNYAKGRGIVVIPGIEFDSCDELSDEIHILGYNVDYDNKTLKKVLSDVKRWRAQRNDLMLKALNNMGYDISIDDLLEVNGGHFIGKPTFAQVMVNKGYFENLSEVFDKVFTVEPELKSIVKKTLRSDYVIRLIHEAGGIAVLAHPMQQRRKGESDEVFYKRIIKFMDRFREYGIDAIECSHPSATEDEARGLREYAAMYKLKTTTGSDFHSDNNKRVYR